MVRKRPPQERGREPVWNDPYTTAATRKEEKKLSRALKRVHYKNIWLVLGEEQAKYSKKFRAGKVRKLDTSFQLTGFIWGIPLKS